MKIKLEFDLTPKEFRESLGLPDVSGLQKRAVDALQKRVENDIKNFDATKLFNAWVTQGLDTSVQVQRFLTKAVGTAIRGRTSGEAAAEEDGKSPAKKRASKKKS